MKKSVKITLLSVSFLLIIYLAVGEFFYRVAFGISTRNETVNLEYQLKNNLIDTAFMNAARYERVSVESRYDYLLDGFYFYADSTVDKTLVVCHGVGGHKYGMFKLVPMFLKIGFNVFVYDTRAHGESGGEKYSFGFYEKFDIERVVTFIEENYPSQIVGLYGESMGAASILQHIEINKQHNNVDFYIADCGYSDLKKQFSYRLKQDYALPDMGIIAFASLMTRIHDGYFFSEVSPVKSVAKTEIPILFIHGKADDYVPFFMGEELYKAKSNNKQFFWVDSAKHVSSFTKDPEVYADVVAKFLQEQHLIQ